MFRSAIGTNFVVSDCIINWDSASSDRLFQRRRLSSAMILESPLAIFKSLLAEIAPRIPCAPHHTLERSPASVPILADSQRSSVASTDHGGRQRSPAVSADRQWSPPPPPMREWFQSPPIEESNRRQLERRSQSRNKSPPIKEPFRIAADGEAIRTLID